ncbi:hypothetical protein F4776DRAFT_139463 [Hypoxylon sp. NC0597]|nr:hypothetical protein F4776DRAFT_139463 [Hypoxylon sp. NC0597]
MKTSAAVLLLATGTTTAAYGEHELLVNFQSNISHAIYNIRHDVINIQNTFRELQPQPSADLLAKGQALYLEYQDLAYATDAKLINLIDWSYKYQKEAGN